jgi:hypothetical protein
MFASSQLISFLIYLLWKKVFQETELSFEGMQAEIEKNWFRKWKKK